MVADVSKEHDSDVVKGIGKGSRFAGYRLLEFAQVSRNALKEVAELLTPYEEDIIDRWVETQFSAWPPPAFSRGELKQVFGGLFRNMLSYMRARQLEKCIEYLEAAGASLAVRNFPYEALIISFHFLEESYMPFLIESRPEKTLGWLVGLDEFLHAALAAIATSYFHEYRKELLNKAEVGRIVQQKLLSDIPKHIMDLEVAHIYLPAGELAKIGGDFIDLFTVGSEEAVFIVGDLSGHGLEASVDAAMLRFQFRSFIWNNPDLVDAMVKTNRILVSELQGNQFATALAGIYNGNGRLKLVSAGHPTPVICKSNCYMLKPGGIALAIDKESAYSLNEVILETGAIFVAYTDGLIEARRGDEFFGEEKLIDIVSRMRRFPARAVADSLQDEALRFAEGKLKDDMAILVLKRLIRET